MGFDPDPDMRPGGADAPETYIPFEERWTFEDALHGEAPVSKSELVKVINATPVLTAA